MERFAGRLTPIGWLASEHIHGISRVTTNAEADDASLDLEVMMLWGILNQKVKGDSEYLKRWRDLQDQMDELAANADGMDPRGLDAKRLQVRVEQFEALVSAAVRTSVLDVADLPVDDDPFG